MKIDHEKAHHSYQEGRLAMEKGNYEKAITAFNCSNKISPHFKTLELLGECFLDKNKPLEAILSLAASVGLGTKPFRGRYLLAKALMQVDQKSDAILQLNISRLYHISIKIFLAHVRST